MKSLLLTFDVEHFSVYRGSFQDKKDYFDISKKGLEEIYRLLKKHQLPATLFLEEIFAERYPKLISRFFDLGCEFALHCYRHDQKYAHYPESESRTILSRAKKNLEKLFGVKIIGFRGPGMSRPSYRVLHDIGIRYDSSLHPMLLPGYYHNLFATRNIHVVDSVVEIPISVTPLLRLPLSWLWFRLFGVSYEKICSRLALLNSDYLNLYFHPWDFADFRSLSFDYPLRALIAHHSGDIALRNLDRYLSWTIKQNYVPQTISTYLKSRGYL